MVCSACGRHERPTAWERIAQLADRDSFRETNKHLWSSDPLTFSADDVTYEKRVEAAQATTGLMDAVVTGRARITGLEVVLAVFDFRFLGGSMGAVVGEKIARAFGLARRERLPAVVVTASGGARMQEGMVALFQMARTSVAAARLRESGVPLIAVLADPTMGGVLASFASLADYVIAEPGARVSFVGPRVHESALLDGTPPGTAEFAFANGLVDAILPRSELRSVVGSLALMLTSAPVRAGAASVPLPTPGPVGRHAWETVELARHPDRPSGRALAQIIFSDLVEIHGDRQGLDDASVMAAVGLLGQRPVVVVAQDRTAPGGGRTAPAGYRKCQRAYTLAERFRLPLITLVDTPGAAADSAAEIGGVTTAIAESLARLGRLRTPVVNVVVGEGGSGGALALAVGDRLLMMENAIFSVIAPEAASAILFRDAAHTQQLAGSLKVTAADLQAMGLVDRVIPEQPPAHLAPVLIGHVIRRELAVEVAELSRASVDSLLRDREAKVLRPARVRGRFRLLVRPLGARGRRRSAAVGTSSAGDADTSAARV